MSKKKEMKNIFDKLDVESSDAHAEISGSAQQNSSPEVPDANANQEDAQMSLRAEMQSAEQEEQAGQESSAPAMEQVEEDEISLRAEMLAAQEEGPDQESPSSEEEAGAEENASLPMLEMSAAEPEQAPGQETDEESPDDLLEDVRKSLLEEEAQEQQPRWWKRIGRSSRTKKAEEEAPKPAEEINLPALAAIQATDAEEKDEEDEYQEQIDELIDMLDQEDEPVEKGLVAVSTETGPAPEVEPEKPVDLEELKKQAFQPRPPEEEKENLSEVRSIALEGDEEVFVEVEAKKQDALEERLDAVENALKPYRRYINFGFAFVGAIMAVVALFLIYSAYQRSVALNAPTPIPSNLPYPTNVSLPGGWQFQLGKGALTTDGSWNPAGAEWLQGTEVCRWVALPWSRQLEAVIRTLNKDDTIELGMSNNDKLDYKVYSIKQMSPAEMRNLDSNSPCLLIVLAEPNAEKRWVLTSLP